MPKQTSQPVKEIKVDKAEFDQAIARLLAAPAITKKEISKRGKFRDRRRPLTKPILQQ
jgi:hypothetical protein